MTALGLLLAWLTAAPALPAPLDVRDPAAWTATASEAVEARLARDPDGSLCLEYDFHGVSGYAVLRRAWPVDWPAAFALRTRLKARGPVNDLQVKVVDASGDNVWWVNRPAWAGPAALSGVTFKSGHFGFAWGPISDRTLRRTEALELVVAAREGGKGALCTTGVSLEPREPDPAAWPEPTVRRGAGGAVDWDFGRVRDLEGVAITWPARGAPGGYELEGSVDGRRFTTLRKVGRTAAGFEVAHLPETEARVLRFRLPQGGEPPRLVELRDRTQWKDLNAALSELARRTPRGHVPRAFLGEQNFWALVGVDGGGERSALLSEDGAVELGRGGYSVEPALVLEDGRLVTWADAGISHRLRDGDLPMPEVRFAVSHSLELEVAAAAEGPGVAPRLLVRYAIVNRGRDARTVRLLLAVRPWQVNPPQQFLTTPGGASRIDRLRWAPPRLEVNGRPGPTFSTRPAKVTALGMEGGIDLRALRGAPDLGELTDPLLHASALLEFELAVAGGETRTVSFTAPLGGDLGRGPTGALEPDPPPEPRLDAVARGWRAKLDRVRVDVPASAAAIPATLRTTLAHVLMSRDGAMLKPGTRSYARTWIRDGAMMASGLLRMGEADAARDFVDAFSRYVYPSGKVPCCADARGADPVVENDSHGQYLYAVAEVYRHTQDPAFLARHWPVVQRVVAWMEDLRQSTRTPEFRASHPAKLVGLLPPSISHEGYSDKPAYSYWDDFWAIRGYRDAVAMARALGHAEEGARWATWAAELEADVARSADLVALETGGTLAGAADRADFDPTSSTVALDPAQARLSPGLLERTFERYWVSGAARAFGAQAYPDYTPYELRTVGALVRLGQPERARRMLEFFLEDRRPAAWNQWAEVVMPDPRTVHFLGDMPHAWVSSDYLRSALDLFAFEREADGALILGAGLAPAWVAEGTGIAGLSTWYGTLTYRLAPAPRGHLLELGGGLAAPPGGVRLAWPLPGPLPRALHAGRELRWRGRELVLPPGPATVKLEAP
ncbi:MAG: hypothetical protein QM704_16625 [Anaeromyxobacteraceae bacterium]